MCSSGAARRWKRKGNSSKEIGRIEAREEGAASQVGIEGDAAARGREGRARGNDRGGMRENNVPSSGLGVVPTVGRSQRR